MKSTKIMQKPIKFKIQVIKKKDKRIKSSPHTNIINRSAQKVKINDNNNQIMISSQIFNPQKQIEKLRAKAKSRSVSDFQKIIEDQQCKLMNQLINKKIKIIKQQQSTGTQLKISKIIDKKLVQNQFGKRKKDYNNPFQDYNIVKCQSITLFKVNRKNRTQTRKSSSIRQQNVKPRRVIKINDLNTSRIMSFNLSIDPDVIYMKKIKQYFDFLFKVNFSNRKFANMELKQLKDSQFKRHKIFVGWGNNHQIIKYCFKSRFWVQLTDNFNDPQIRFYWTPWPIKQIHSKQKIVTKNIEQIPAIYHKNVIKYDDQITNLNKKLFIDNDCQKVENFITSNGYIVPFSQSSLPSSITNHLTNSSCISHKKKLFHSIFHYYSKILSLNPFTVIPLTYSVTGVDDPQYRRFVRDNQQKIQRVWIIKPGQCSNRGQGIQIAKTSNVAQLISLNKRQSYIIQLYIDRPLLYNGRKFDIRHYILVTSVNSIIKAYWFKQGYIRTSSQFFNLQNLADKYIHLTNDAIQQTSKNYGCFEVSNKISYSQFQRYLETIFPNRNINFQQQILSKMKEIVTNVIKASHSLIDNKKGQANFQLFGIDFMIDRQLRPWLIQINENPCLETSCPLLTRLIHSLIQNTLRLCFDPQFPPISHFPPKQRSNINDHYLKSLKFQIIFNELYQAKQQKQTKLIMNSIQTW